MQDWEREALQQIRSEEELVKRYRSTPGVQLIWFILFYLALTLSTCAILGII